MKIRLIITGGRDFDNYPLVIGAIESIKRNRDATIIEIVEGVCPVGKETFYREDGTIVHGADGLAERYAKEFQIPLKPLPADWKKYGKPAGPIRNKEMAAYVKSFPDPTICLSFWDGISVGTSGMMKIARANGIEVIEVNY